MVLRSSARTRTWNSSADELTALQNVLSDPFPSPAAFQFAFPPHRLSAGLKLLLMRQPPRARMTLGVKSAAVFRVVVLSKTVREIIGLPDVDLPLRVHQDVHRVTQG